MIKLNEIVESVSITYDFSKTKEVIFLNTGDIQKGKILVSSYSDVQHLPGQAKKTIKNGDILYSEIRPQNQRFCLVNVPNPQGYVVSTKLMVLRFKNNNYNPDFVYQYITQDTVVNKLQILAESRSGTFPQITFSELGSIEIPEYSFADQQHIVNILGSLDDKIENNEKLVRKMHDLAMLYYQDLFGNSSGEIALNDVADIIMGQAPSSDSYNESGEGMTFYQGRTDFGMLFPKERLYTTAPSRLAKKGNVLFSVRAPVGDVNIASDNCCIGRGLAAINNKLGFDSNASIYYALIAAHPDFDIYNGSGTVFGCINKNEINNTKLKIDTINKLKIFDSKVSTLFEKSVSTVKENIKLVALKKSYLKKFFD